MNMRVGIFGAGQAGVMAAVWLPANQQLVCYIDNKIEKQGQIISGVPVCSLLDALGKQLDLIWIAVLNQEARATIKEQLAECGYSGKILDIQTYRETQDIRLSALRLIVDEIKRRQVAGDMAELGVYQGAFAAEMNRLMPEKKLYLFDTFEGFHRQDIVIEENRGYLNAGVRDFSDTSIELVRKRLPHPEQAVFCQGHFPESLEHLSGEVSKLAFVSLDSDLYEPTYQGLQVFYPKLRSGGMILIHDYNSMQFPGVKEAVVRFCEEQRVYVMPLMDLHGSAVLIRQSEA